MEYEIRHEGLTDFTLSFRAVRDFRDEITDAMREAAEAAGQYMRRTVPYHSGSLFRSINIGPLVYKPGASGGGGFYEIIVGVDRDTAPHAEFVIEGTGIYNRENPTNGIFPSRGNVMVFSQGGDTIFTRWTRGQEAQTDWFENAQEIADSIIARKIAGT